MSAGEQTNIFAVGAWNDALAKFFKRLGDKNALEEFGRIMRMEAERASRAAANIGQGEEARLDYLATVRICYGIADDAQRALTARTGAANASGEEGFPRGAAT